MAPRDSPFLYDLGGSFNEVETGNRHDQGVGGRLGLATRMVADAGVGGLDMELNGLLMAAAASASSHRHRLAQYADDASFASSPSSTSVTGSMGRGHNGERETVTSSVRSRSPVSSTDFKRGLPNAPFLFGIDGGVSGGVSTDDDNDDVNVSRGLKNDSYITSSILDDSQRRTNYDGDEENDESDDKERSSEICVGSTSSKKGNRETISTGNAGSDQQWQRMTNVNKRHKSSVSPKSSFSSHGQNQNSVSTVCRSKVEERKVKFDKIHIREYIVVEGNHPCCRAPPAITMGWEVAEDFRDIPFESFEAVRSPSCSLSSSTSYFKDDEDSTGKKTSLPKYFDTHSSSPRRHRRQLRMDVATRRKWLGWSADEDEHEDQIFSNSCLRRRRRNVSRKTNNCALDDFEIDFLLSQGESNDFDYLFGMDDEDHEMNVEEIPENMNNAPTLEGEDDDAFVLFEDKNNEDSENEGRGNDEKLNFLPLYNISV